MNQKDEAKDSTPTRLMEGNGSPSPFLITVTKEGHLVVRLPVSLLKYVLGGLGLADAASAILGLM